MAEMVCVYTFGARSEAELGKMLLSQQGIQSIVMADDAGGMLAPMGRGARLMAPAADEAEARRILEDLHDASR